MAGLFYPSNADGLFEEIHRCFTHHLGPGRFPNGKTGVSTKRVECIIVPHAGYEYSGPVAAHSYSVAHDFFHSNPDKKITAIIFGPNHYGIGSGVAASASRFWSTPLGKVEVDVHVVEELVAKSDLIDRDDIAHSREHSIEVQLPFLQAVSASRQDLSIVPISLMLQDEDTARSVAEAISRVIDSTNRIFLVIGSSDLTHYEPQNTANVKDKKLLDEVHRLDTKSFYTVLERNNISSCGYGAIAVVMNIAKKIGNKEGRILKYATSGDVTGDLSSVVGYSSVHFV